MKKPEIPYDEKIRLDTLRSLGVLDTPPEERYDRLTRTAKRLFGVPIALVSLIDENRQWFKSCVGVSVSETPRDISFCGHAILGDEVLVIPDATKDVRFADNPLVLSGPEIRFYAGCPLNINGHKMGTLCLIDPIARSFSEEDITALKDLASMVEHELLNAELKIAKEAAEASARAKSVFLAAMSHEIRTPMNGVLGMLELLKKSKLEVVQRDQVHVAISSVTSLLGLINDILDFSKIEAGKLDLEILEFDLVRELEAFAQSIAFKAKEKGLRLILNTDKISYPNIITDPGRLRQILTNLVGNAVKFTNRGQILISASLDKINDTNGRLHIDVIDTGIGVHPEKIESLFEPFIQADSSTTRKFCGTGLGLSIVTNLCELMGGAITATSVVGEGSTFSVTLTVKLGSDQSLVKRAEEEIASTHEENIVWPANVRILLVEDNVTNQLVANGILEIFGLHADIASNGFEAIEAIRVSLDTQPYSIVLMDCQMPEMDGYDATRAVRQGEAGEENKHLPIIAMTANAMQGDREKCTDAGMDDYISKPIDFSVLKSALIKWILKKESSAQLAKEQAAKSNNFIVIQEALDERAQVPNETLSVFKAYLIKGIKPVARKKYLDFTHMVMKLLNLK